jgi:hypothetical protein
MSMIDKLWLAALTRNTSNAGSGDVLNVTINMMVTMSWTRISSVHTIRDKDFSSKPGHRKPLLPPSRRAFLPTLRFASPLEEMMPGVRNTLCC